MIAGFLQVAVCSNGRREAMFSKWRLLQTSCLCALFMMLVVPAFGQTVLMRETFSRELSLFVDPADSVQKVSHI